MWRLVLHGRFKWILLCLVIFLAFIYSLYTMTVILFKNTGLLVSRLRNNYAPFNTKATTDF